IDKSFEVYREWLALARPAPRPDNLRRPLWLPRGLHADASAHRLGERQRALPRRQGPGPLSRGRAKADVGPIVKLRLNGAARRGAATSASASSALFNHLIGLQQQRLWNRQPECPRGLEIDDQLEPRGLFDR